MNTLTLEQRAAIDANGEIVVIVAGPGSGKTHMMVERVIADIERSKSAPETTAIITFTNAAAKELERRLAAKGVPRLAFVGTLHGLCLKLLNKGRETPLTVLDETTAGEIAELVIDKNHLKTTVEKLGKAIAGYGLRAVEAEGQQLQLAVTLYRKFLSDENAVDHDLVLIEALKLIQNVDPGLRALYVDEFQDSAPVDLAIYRALRLNLLFVVGDPDQAIYGFRGGDVGGLMTLINDPLATVVYLQDCFRCAPEIAAAADRLIAKNVMRAPKKIRSRVGAGGMITAASYPTETEERAALADAIRTRIAAGTPPEDIAVLVRYNREREELTRLLSSASIPLAGEKPREPADWRLATAVINVLANPESVVSVVAWRVAGGESLRDAFTAVRAQKAAGDAIRPVWANPSITIDTALECAGVSLESRYRIADIIDATGADCPLEVAYAIRETLKAPGTKGVTLSTYHSAKGLEWREVFLPSLEQSTTPGTKTAVNVEEERRLVFVAITRAETMVTISAADAKLNPYKKVIEPTGGLSQFVAESMEGEK